MLDPEEMNDIIDSIFMKNASKEWAPYVKSVKINNPGKLKDWYENTPEDIILKTPTGYRIQQSDYGYEAIAYLTGPLPGFPVKQWPPIKK